MPFDTIFLQVGLFLIRNIRPGGFDSNGCFRALSTCALCVHPCGGFVRMGSSWLYTNRLEKQIVFPVEKAF